MQAEAAGTSPSRVVCSSTGSRAEAAVSSAQWRLFADGRSQRPSLFINVECTGQRRPGRASVRCPQSSGFPGSDGFEVSSYGAVIRGHAEVVRGAGITMVITIRAQPTSPEASRHAPGITGRQAAMSERSHQPTVLFIERGVIYKPAGADSADEVSSRQSVFGSSGAGTIVSAPTSVQPEAALSGGGYRLAVLRRTA